jgi:hypothetical protein
MKKVLKITLTSLALLTVSFSTLAVGIKNVTTSTSLSSQSGIEVSLIVAGMISLIIILSSKKTSRRKQNKNSVY